MRGVAVFGIVMVLSMPIFGQIWVARYNGLANDDDKSQAIAVDSSGNIYVTGESWGLDTKYDYATVKYNTSGVEQWVARYNGPDSNHDYAKAIAVNRNCVYVTGGSMDLSLYTDCVMVKYNTSGDSLWVARYDGPANDNDCAFAIAVDKSRNVYSTGYGTGSGTWWDYATIKYDTSGVEQWVARYNGPADYHDEASAIAVDGSGNVYVTGSSAGLGTGTDYTTIKYNSSGDSLWVRRYNGPGNATDWANAITVDDSGNIYVAGYSADSVTDCDYATVKYNTSGVEQWVARYNGPADGHDEVKAITVDESGNVYVTGSSYGSGTGTDYTTIKYNSSGDSLWVRRYNGPGNATDWANAIAVDGDYVYVTGESKGSGTNYDYATIKYSCAGVEEESAKCKVQNAKLEISPNPFFQKTVIRIQVPDVRKTLKPNTYHLTPVTLSIYDITGRAVKILVNGEKDAGSYNISFDAKELSPGIYFARFVVGNYKDTKKLILVR